MNCPYPGSRAFEVMIYNRQVRALLKENVHHRDYGDRWGDAVRHMVEAKDADEAKEIAARRYPPEEGFVIASVSVCERPGPIRI